MDSMSAFARGEMSRGAPTRVFDWVRAAERINEVKPSMASAGLSGDWEYTGGLIYTADGIPDEDDTYVFLASTWAIPELSLDGAIEDCWTWQGDTGWGAHTYWPEEARRILSGDRNEETLR